MKGTTKFIDFASGNVINNYSQPIDLPYENTDGQTIELEEATEGKPSLTPYIITKKRVMVSISGDVHIEYTVSQCNDSVKQKYFLQ
jgi:hypothetical protein